MSKNTLYDECNSFYLAVNDFTEYQVGTVVDTTGMVPIDEPVGWDNVRANLKRDLDTHGVTFSFTDGEQELNFECANGRQVLRATYLTYGTDAQVKFLFGETDPDTNNFTARFVGDVNFNIYKFDDLYSIANVEARDFGRLVNSRLEDKVPLDIDVPEAVEVGLGSKLFPQLLNLNHTGFGLFNEFVPLTATGSNKAYYMPQYTEGATTKYGELTIPNYSGTFVGENPQNIKRYLYQVERGGFFRLDINTCIEIPAQDIILRNRIKLKSAIWREESKSFIQNGQVGESSYEVRYANGTIFTAAQRQGAAIPTFVGMIAERYYFSGYDQNDLNIPEQLFEGDEVYLYFEIETINLSNIIFPMPVGALIRIPSDLNEPAPFRYKLVSNVSFPASKIEALKVKDCLIQVLKELVKDNAAYDDATIVSDFLDNCGDNLVLTNGLTLRAANATQGLDETVKVSMKEILDTLRAIYNTGFNFEYDGVDKVIRIEPASYYYRDIEILDLDEPYDYIEEAYPETTYNEVEAGFKTFNKQRDDSSDFKDSSIEDINAKSNYGLPIRTAKNKYSIIAPIIFSSFEIEAQRRIQFDTEETAKEKSYKNDDEVFGIAISDIDVSAVLDAVSNGTNKLLLFGAIRPFIEVGDSIRLVNLDFSPTFGAAVTVSEIEYTGLTTKITYTGTPLTLGTFSGSGTTATFLVRVQNQTGARTVNESREPYSFISGAGTNAINIDYYLETEYNLRFTPKRMLLSHGSILNNCLLEKADSDVIRFIDGEGNTELTTILKSSEDCPNGDTNYVSLTEGSDLSLINFNDRKALYRNRIIKFKHLISWDDFNNLEKAMRNTDGTKDYGYISFPDLDDVIRKAFLLDCKFNVYNNEAEFELIEVSSPTEVEVELTKLNVSNRSATSTGACQLIEPTQTFFSEDETIIVGSDVYPLVTLTGAITDGFYKWFISDTESKVIEVTSNEIVSINDCPDVFEVNVGQTSFGSSTLACNGTDNIIIRYSSDSVLDVGSVVFVNSSLVTTLGSGFYKISGNRVIQVDASGEVLAITTCAPVFSYTGTTVFGDGASACQSVSGVTNYFSLDDPLAIGSTLYTDGTLVTTLPEGFYKIIDTGDTVFVDSSGEVISIINCANFEEKTYYYGAIGASSPTEAQILTLNSASAPAPTDLGEISERYVVLSGGTYYYFVFPDVWFELVNIVDGFNDLISWFSNWERISDVTVDGELCRVYRTVEQMDTIDYIFKFIFRDI